MLTKTLTDQRAWTAATVDAAAAWYYPLPADCFSTLEPSLIDLRRNPQPATSLPISRSQSAAWAENLKPARTALASGRGFVILDRVPLERYSDPEAQAIYWLIGQMLGTPCAQNVQGTLLYDVRDTGQDVAQGARFSVTSYESSFHTDNSFGSEIVDYVGLLCLHTAKTGGLSQLLSAYALHNELLAHHTRELETLYQPFHFDRRGGVREGESPTVQYPIFAWDGRDLTVRYLRYWIEAGQQKIGEPLTPAQGKALDVLDNLSRRRDLLVEFNLEPGQMFFINNRWLLHNRTAFTDYPEPERRRHYVRLWLKRPVQQG
jgi:alpha-ketoglutarate-dependent taurine dioxygenase